jgi:hypothetical protein
VPWRGSIPVTAAISGLRPSTFIAACGRGDKRIEHRGRGAGDACDYGPIDMLTADDAVAGRLPRVLTGRRAHEPAAGGLG